MLHYRIAPLPRLQLQADVNGKAEGSVNTSKNKVETDIDAASGANTGGAQTNKTAGTTTVNSGNTTDAVIDMNADTNTNTGIDTNIIKADTKTNTSVQSGTKVDL